MNLDPLTSALSHIGNLIITLTKKNINSIVHDILEVVDAFGVEAEREALQLILHEIEQATPSTEYWPATTATTHQTNDKEDNETSPDNKHLLVISKYSAAVPPSRFLASLSQAILQSHCIAKSQYSRIGRSGATSWLSGLLRQGLKLSLVQETCVLLHLLCNASAAQLPADHRTDLAALISNRVQALSASVAGSTNGGELSDTWVDILHELLTGLREGGPLPINKSPLSTLSSTTNTTRSPSSQLSLSTTSLSSSIVSHFPLSTPSSPLSTATNSSAVSGIVANDVLNSLLSLLQCKYPVGGSPTVLAPLLCPHSNPPPAPASAKGSAQQSLTLLEHSLHPRRISTTSSMSDSQLADLLLDLGASNNSSVEECRSNLSSLNRSVLNATAVARLIAALVRHHITSRHNNDQIGLQNLANPSSLWNDSKEKGTGGNGSSGGAAAPWNIEVVMQAIVDVAPVSISAKDVIVKLDHKNFLVTDRIGLNIFVTAIKKLSASYGMNFPVEYLYHVWQNVDEHIILLNSILHNPDIFCFTDYQCNPVNVDMLKTVPELENKEVATWRSMNLIELLLSLDSAPLYTATKTLFNIGRQNCPDVLTIALIQSTSPFSMLKQELLGQLVPLFLEPHPNTPAVVQAAWYTKSHRTAMRQLIIRCMSEWYMQQENDQSRLSRILDVAQDMKALSVLLNAQPFPFVIDLACLSFRREFLKLDMWLSDKVKEHGELFLSSLVKFVQQRCPQLGAAVGEDTPLPKASQLPHDTLTTITQCLSIYGRSVMNQELSESIMNISQSSMLVNRQRNNINSLLGFPNQQDALAGLTTGLGGLSLANNGTTSGVSSATASSAMFPGGLGGAGSIGSGAGGMAASLSAAALAGSSLNAPGSPSRGAGTGGGGPLGAVATAVAAQQQSMGGAQQQHQPAIGSQLVSQPGPMDIATIFELPAMVSKEVEDEANSFFQRIYNNPPNSTLTIKEILELLKKFHESSVKKEREVYSCMLRNLFEEYKFFPTYPHKELFTTAKLFGGIIDQGLVEYMALGVALRYVMEALQKALNSKMFHFGVLALDKFRTRLKEYPRYCHHIMAIEHFSSFPQHLSEWVRYGTQLQEPPSRPSGPVLPPELEHLDSTVGSSHATSSVFHQPSNVLPPAPPPHPTSIASQRLLVSSGSGGSSTNSSKVPAGAVGSAVAATTTPITRPQSVVAAVVGAPVGGAKAGIATTDIETLLVASEEKTTAIRQPTEQQNDKIAFIFNNLSQVNLPQKCDELLDVVTEECWPWVAQYLVMKRASIEANFHNLYSNFLDQLKHSTFTKTVVDETLRNIKVLLKVEKNSANFSDKSLLKNLGHWLGLLTIAKNKPILHVDINVKSLLIEAYLKGTHEMQYVVPFVTKVLESCGKSKVFKPPNPWTMALMNVLAEVHALQDMKLHLKFEIEVLCNKLEITVDSLKPGTVLHDASPATIQEYQLSPSSNFSSHGAVAVAAPSDPMTEAVAAALGRAKRAESTPLLPTMPNFPNQSFLPNVSVSVSEGVGLGCVVSGPGSSSSAGATPTPQLPPHHAQASIHNTPAHSTPTPASHHTGVVSTQGGNSNAGTAGTAVVPAPHVTERLFTYAEVNVTTLRGLEQHISLNNIPMLAELSNQAQLKNIVRQAVEVAVQEVLAVVMDRSVRIAISTVETLVKKDFALDPDDNHVRASSHLLVRNLTASMAMITCKDYLTSTIAKSIKQKLSPTFVRGNNSTQEQQVEQLSNAIAAENLSITCAFIQKTCAEKSVMEVEKRLSAEFEARKVARSESRHYCDTAALTYQAERMPDQMRLKVGRVTQQQMQVYEDFGRHIPGFASSPEVDTTSSLMPKAASAPFGVEELSIFVVLTERLVVEIEHTAQAFNTMSPDSPVTNMLHTLFTMLTHIRSNRDIHTIPLLVKKCVEHLFEGSRELPSDPELSPLVLKFRDIHLLLLKTIAEPRIYGVSWTTKAVTKCWGELRDDVKHNVDVVDWLLRSSLINMPMFDEMLARSFDDPRSHNPVFFAMQIIQVYFVEDNNQGVISQTDLTQTLESLIRICHTRQSPEALMTLLDTLRMKHDMVVAAGERNTTTAAAAAAAAVVAAAAAVRQNAVTAAAPLAAQQTTTPALPSAAAAAAVVAATQQSTSMATNITSSVHFHSGVNQARDFKDPQGLQEKTEELLREWISLYHSPSAGPGSSTAFTHFVKQMNLHGILKTDELITRFFRNCVSYCREICIRSIADQQQNHPQPSGSSQIPTTSISAIAISQLRNKCFQHVDPFVRLVALLIKHSGEATNPSTKINLLNKVLGLVCGIMIHDIESNNTEYYQLPYHRILIMLFLELNAPEPVLESINLSVLMAFTQTLHLLRPSKCAGFAYAWLEIVSHRVFIGRMLAITPQQKGWAMYSMLLSDLFKFLAPYLRNAELAKPLTKLYKGTLRVLLVLLHDFPEFLCEYHYTFCDAIPPNCIQMRNLILSAFPRNMRLPDPFTPNLKVDMLPEIAISPKIHANVASFILPLELRDKLDSYLKNRTPVTFLTELRGYLQAATPAVPVPGSAPQQDDGMRYNIKCLNALVVHVGMQAIAHIQAKGQTPSMSTIAHSAHMDIFQNLAVDMDTEGRYLFLNAIANQLRYPNSHTHYFSCTLLTLFAEANTEAIQEQITRVLLERLIVNRPHPWGLLITFIELIKNPTYKFWSHEFVRCAPEIEKLFESVARSCMVSKMSASTAAAVQRDLET